MNDRGILMTAPNVLAILEDRKTQTRRIAKPRRRKCPPSLLDGTWSDSFVMDEGNREWLLRDSRYGKAIGDRLYVCETWQHANHPLGPWQPGCATYYRADYLDDRFGPDGEKSRGQVRRVWRSAMLMPRAVARVRLELVRDVWAQRLQDISEADAIAEGVERVGERWESRGIAATPVSAADAYRGMWEYLNGAGSWGANPLVFVYTFKRVTT